jgi:hypothetical protein
MHFSTKSYLKSNHNHTVKHTFNLELCFEGMYFHATSKTLIVLDCILLDFI